MMLLDFLAQSLLALDAKMLDFLFVCHKNNKLPKFIYYVCLLCELTGHGVLWFAASIITFLFVDHQEARIISLYLFILLVIDIVLVAPIKVYFKRPRPSANEGRIMWQVSEVDNYAFPSGHASRAVAVALFMAPWFGSRVGLMMYAWALCVSASRVLMGRHHPSDVIAGVLAGFIIAWCTNLVLHSLRIHNFFFT